MRTKTAPSTGSRRPPKGAGPCRRPANLGMQPSSVGRARTRSRVMQTLGIIAPPKTEITRGSRSCGCNALFLGLGPLPPAPPQRGLPLGLSRPKLGRHADSLSDRHCGASPQPMLLGHFATSRSQPSSLARCPGSLLPLSDRCKLWSAIFSNFEFSPTRTLFFFNSSRNYALIPGCCLAGHPHWQRHGEEGVRSSIG